MSWTRLVGHDDILELFRNALKRKRLGHGFLFVGMSGIGKRRVARAIAQGLLCETNPPEAVAPCGFCAGCRQVEASNHPDFEEIRRPPDMNILPLILIQELCGMTFPQSQRPAKVPPASPFKLSLRAMRGHYKVAIVDDADLLEDEGANAFLKTLEEPPPGTILFLLGSSVETQLATIVSRCQIIRFTELTADQVTNVILQLEITNDPAEARRLALRGGGSVERALILADDIWTEARANLYRALADKNPRGYSLGAELWKFIEDAGKENTQKRARAAEIIQLTMDFFRQVLRAQQLGVIDPGWEFPHEVSTLANHLDPEILADILDRCQQADYQLARYLTMPLTIETWIDDIAQLYARVPIFPVQDRGIV